MSDTTRISPMVRFALSLLLVVSAAPSYADAFTPGNLLTATGGVLREYTREGTLLQSWPVSHPTTSRFDSVDVVVDRLGRAHVLVIAPFDDSYIATLDPVRDEWTLLRIEAFLGNGSDGDLAILGDFLFTKALRINWVTGDIEPIDAPFLGIGEINIGLDGFLYTINSGSPRYRVEVFDPATLEIVRSFELRDETGTRLNGRGIAVSADGETIYVADWDGRFYVFDGDGNFLDSNLSGTNSLNDIDLTPGGLIASGQRFGDAVITDIAFENPLVLSIDAEYVAFVPDASERVDEDEDGVLDLFDNCPDDPNPDQENLDGDEFGDVCDPYPANADNLQVCQEELSSCESETTLQNDEIAALRLENELLRAELALCQESGPTLDEDGDGVFDGEDQCPGSSSIFVDAEGCTHDQFCEERSGTRLRDALQCVTAQWSTDSNRTQGGRCRVSWSPGEIRCKARGSFGSWQITGAETGLAR